MKKYTNLLLIVFCILNYSCSWRKNNLKYILTGGSIRYWNCEWTGQDTVYWKVAFSFDKEGNVKKYFLNQRKNEWELFTDDGVVPDKKWNVSGDTILRFYYTYFSHKILKYNEDTIWLRIGNENEMLIRVKGALNVRVPTPEPERKNPSFPAGSGAADPA